MGRSRSHDSEFAVVKQVGSTSNWEGTSTVWACAWVKEVSRVKGFALGRRTIGCVRFGGGLAGWEVCLRLTSLL